MKNFVYRNLILVILVFSISGTLLGQNTQDFVFPAIEDEMTRSLKDLKWKSFDKPYFLEYVIEDVDSLTIQATFGALKRSTRQRNRLLLTQVRVGNYDLDSGAVLPYPLPVDDDYESIRRAVWFSTDEAYKRAIDQFESVKAAKESIVKEEEDEDVPSFSKEKTVVSIGKPGVLEVDQEKWEKHVRDWSAIFRSYPKFNDSYVNFYVRQSNRYLVNSEGTKVLKPELLITVDIHTNATSKDGSSIGPYKHIFATSFDEILNVEAINKEIRSLADEVKTFEDAAELKETYIGPAIFTEGASAQLFIQLLAPELENSGGDSPIDSPGVGSSGFGDRIGRRVLPAFLSVVDDPTMTKFGNMKLAGNYEVDDEGVEAKPLTLIENGILRTLLATRNPSKKIRNSNGRARGAGADMSNLIVSSKNGKTFAELKAQMIAECKEQGLPFGIIFRGNNATFSSFTNGGAVLAYKVNVTDGREEIFKGATITDFAASDLRRILGAGNDPYAFNFLINSSYSGTGTPASIVAPTVLVEEINLRKTRLAKEKPKMVTHPYFSK